MLGDLFDLYYSLLATDLTHHLQRKGKEMVYLTMHSTHFIYGYMVSDIW